MRAVAIAVLLSTLAGCQTVGPTWSEVTGRRYHQAIADRHAVNIVRVDDHGAFAYYPIKVEPGRHEIVIESLRHGQFPGGRQQTMVLDLAPCQRYYLNAQFPDPVQPRFDAVVDETEPVSGCRTP